MGVEIKSYRDSNDFRIKKENVPLALEALKKAVKEGHYYQWSESAFILQSDFLEEAISDLGWRIYEDYEGNVVGIDFEREKGGDEEDWLNILAPFVEEGCYIQIEGDFGLYRLIFKNGKCLEIQPTITWN